jgi:hypothetical protein
MERKCHTLQNSYGYLTEDNRLGSRYETSRPIRRFFLRTLSLHQFNPPFMHQSDTSYSSSNISLPFNNGTSLSGRGDSHAILRTQSHRREASHAGSRCRDGSSNSSYVCSAPCLSYLFTNPVTSQWRLGEADEAS